MGSDNTPIFSLRQRLHGDGGYLTPKYITVIRKGHMVTGTSAIRENNARKIPLRSIFESTCAGVAGSSIMSRDLTREAPRHVRISGIATAPAVSIAKMSELFRNPVGLKNNSS